MPLSAPASSGAGPAPKTRGRVPNAALGDDARSWAFAEFRKALRPLAKANKLGYVLFQLAPWVTSGDEALAKLSGLPRELPGMVFAVELRNRSWFGARTEETLGFLKTHGLTYVSIDGPRTRGAVPSLPALTSPTAVFRLHSRNFQGWLKQVQGKAPTVAEKYDYLYRKPELEEIARAAGGLGGKAERVHFAMNNNRGDYPAKRGVMVGRPFPPMTQHLRVSVGTQAEMDKFVAAFKEIMAAPAKSLGRRLAVTSRGL